MWMQTAHRTEHEKVWINFTNSDGQTITAHAPVNKIFAGSNATSVGNNEAVSKPANSKITGGITGHNLIGLAYEDVAAGDVGIAQVYGYHESVLIAPVAAAVTIRVGEPLTPDLTTTGFNSVGAVLAGQLVIALDTIAGGATSGNGSMLSAALAGAGGYADHVFIRAM